MRNIIIVDIDTERKDQITVLGKPEGFPQPTSKEEVVKMMDEDLLCLCEGLATLINVMHQEKYKDGNTILKECIQLIEDNVKTNIKE